MLMASFNSSFFKKKETVENAVQSLNNDNCMREDTYKFTSALIAVCVKIDVATRFHLQSLIRCLITPLCVVER